jgi:CRISPR-associated protein Cmr2
LKQNRQFSEYLEELKFSDTATTAALNWLAGGTRLDWQRGMWSGQWLHWRSREQDPDEEPCPPRVWDQIQRKKAADGVPPAYFGVLMLDGDALGKLLRGALNPDVPDAWGVGHDRPANISGKLTEFALAQAKTIVEQFSGELVYSGGDDTLALVPLAQVVAAAKALSDRYGADMNGCTVSGGIAVVHYKEDLRFALQQARAAEKAAKTAGRDRLALTVCRRSGEHATTVMTWEQVEEFNRLVALFIDPGVSDRWAYKLREALPTLEGLSRDPVRAELGRLVDRIDNVRDDVRRHFRSIVVALFDRHMTEHEAQFLKRHAADPPRTPDEAERRRRRAFATAVEEFVTLCQSASFLARGRDRS